MDQVTTLQALNDAIATGDARAIAQHATDLAAWVRNGGIVPFYRSPNDWRSSLNRHQLVHYFVDLATLATQIHCRRYHC